MTARATDAPVQLRRARAAVSLGPRTRAESVPGRATATSVGAPPLASDAGVHRMGCGDGCLLSDEGYRAIERSSRPPLINLTVTVQVPGVAQPALSTLEPASVCRTERDAPQPDRFLGHGDAALGQEIFDIAKAHTEAVSRPGELHPQPLVERYVNLSAHTRSHQANTPVIPGDDKWFCLHPHLLLESPVGYGQDRPTSPLRSIAITATSSLLRATPSQCLASVLRFLWGRHLNGSLRIETTGSRSSIEKPGPGSRHLHAGHRLGSFQGNPQTSPDGITLHRFRCPCTGSRRVNGGSLAFVFLIHTCRVMLDVSPTLTTATLNDSRWGWFEAGS